MNDIAMKIFIASLAVIIVWFFYSSERLNSSAQWVLNLVG